MANDDTLEEVCRTCAYGCRTSETVAANYIKRHQDRPTMLFSIYDENTQQDQVVDISCRP